MTPEYKVLGQVAAAATTDTTLYTVPTGKQVVVSSLIVSNRAATVASFRVAIRPGGEALADKHYIAYDVTLAANDSIPLTLGITLGEGDVITVRASNANLSFSAFGSENA